MKHWWSNVKVIVCGIVRCNELKTRCTKIKIHHCVHFSFQVSSAVNSTESNLIDLQPRVGLWACQYESFRFPSFCLRTASEERWERATAELHVGGGLHTLFFFFLAIRHVTCEVWHMLHLLCTVCARLQSGAKRTAVAGFRVQATVILYDQGSGQHWESTFIHHPSCRLFVSDFCLCLDSHALVLLSTPSLVVSLAELSLVPRNQWVINMVL